MTKNEQTTALANIQAESIPTSPLESLAASLNDQWQEKNEALAKQDTLVKHLKAEQKAMKKRHRQEVADMKNRHADEELNHQDLIDEALRRRRRYEQAATIIESSLATTNNTLREEADTLLEKPKNG